MSWKTAVISVADACIWGLNYIKDCVSDPAPAAAPALETKISTDSQDELASAARVLLTSATKTDTHNMKICLEIMVGSNGFGIFIPPNQQEGFDKQPPVPASTPLEPEPTFGEDDVKIKLDMGDFALPPEKLTADEAAAAEESDIDSTPFHSAGNSRDGSEDDV